MPSLLLASLLWALSFPLVKRLALDPDLVTAVRLGLAALAFGLLALRAPAPLPRRRVSALLALGALQFGLMYTLVHRAYAHLAGHQVALFTVLTPLYVVLIEGLLARRWRGRAFGAALLAMGGSLALARFDVASAAWTGFLLVQGANLCFAAGQVLYRRMDLAAPLPTVSAFRWLYLGAALFAALTAGLTVSAEEVDAHLARSLEVHAGVLYLGLVPTALGFMLWNRAASSVAPGVLAAANQLKVPLAVAVALLPPFREGADPMRLAASAGLIGLALVLGRERL